MRPSLPSCDRMLKTVPGGVLASLQGSTYQKRTPRPLTRCGLAWARRVSARRGRAGKKVAVLSGRVKCQEMVLFCDKCSVPSDTAAAFHFWADSSLRLTIARVS